MPSVNERSSMTWRVTCATEVRSVESVSINLSPRIDNSITQGLLRAVDHVRSSVGYENEKRYISINQSINKSFKR